MGSCHSTVPDSVPWMQACVTGQPMPSSSGSAEPKTAASVSYHNSVVDQYKELIRSQVSRAGAWSAIPVPMRGVQDEELRALRKQMEQTSLGNGQPATADPAANSDVGVNISSSPRWLTSKACRLLQRCPPSLIP